MTSGRGQGTRRRLPRPPIALAAALAALAAFGGFYALGRATAGTSSGPHGATPLVLGKRARPHVPLLGLAAALPAPPPAHRAAPHPAATPAPAPAPPPPPPAVPKVAPVPIPAPKLPAGPHYLNGSSVGAPGVVPPNLGCARWASSNGSDAAAGTRSAPFRTVSRLGLALRPGQTGCLVGGSVFAENVKLWRAGAPGRPIKIQTAGSPVAVIRGSVGISWRSHDLVLAGVRVNGSDPGAKAAVTVHGDRISLVRDEITGSFVNRWTPCVDLNYADAAVLDADEIHNCAVATRPTSYAPGIAVRHSRGAVIRNSTVYAVPGNGIALGPGARGTLIRHDVVDGNRSGILIRGSGNVVRSTIVSNSGRFNVHSGKPLGSGNVVAGDCLWSARGALAKGPGIHFVDNVTADPRYAPRAHGVGAGPCYGKRPRVPRTNLGTRWPMLHGITVHYRLQTRPGHVQFDELSFAGLNPRARIVITCSNGCFASDVLAVSAVGTGDASELTGLWIPTGASIEVHARRSGWVGAYVQVRLTGPPHGVVISHACLSPVSGDPVPCQSYEVAR